MANMDNKDRNQSSLTPLQLRVTLSLVLAFLILSFAGKSTGEPSLYCIPRGSNQTTTNTTSPLPICCLSVDEITSGRAIPGSTSQSTPYPPWFNLTLALRGQEFARRNRFSISAGAQNGLLAALSFPDALDVLAFTGKSNTPDKSCKRYMATTVQMFVWVDVMLNSNLTTDNVFFTSMSNVRAFHLNAAKQANSAPKPLSFAELQEFDNVTTDDVMWEAFKADLRTRPKAGLHLNYTSEYHAYDQNATYLNQFIQGLTLAGFMGFTVMYPESCFLYGETKQDFQAFLHLWAVIGYVIGVKDEYNVCLQPNVTAAVTYYEEILDKYVVPALLNIDKRGKVLVESFVLGVFVNGTVPGQTPRTTMFRLLRDFFYVTPSHMWSILSIADQTAEQLWDLAFVPSTQAPTARESLNVALQGAMQAEIFRDFGPWSTNKDKAEKVFYPQLSQ